MANNFVNYPLSLNIVDCYLFGLRLEPMCFMLSDFYELLCLEFNDSTSNLI